MENTTLEWIAEIADKLQEPLTHNERQRLTKIVIKLLPLIIKALDQTAVMKFGQYKTMLGNLEEEFVYSGETCNGCGQDYSIDLLNPRHRKINETRKGEGGQCTLEKLILILKETEEAEDK